MCHTLHKIPILLPVDKDLGNTPTKYLLFPQLHDMMHAYSRTKSLKHFRQAPLAVAHRRDNGDEWQD